MRLVADRFVEDDDARVVDLATGERVVLTITAAGDAPTQHRWAARCDALQKLRHRRIASLVDFGIIGVSERFEAWRCGAVWTGARVEAQRACDRVAQFLHAAGFTCCSNGLAGARIGPRGAVILPDAVAGYPADGDEAASWDLPLEARAIALVNRRPIAALAEMFDATAGSRPHIASLWGPPGSGKTTSVRDLARTARLNGFIPIAARFVDSAHTPLWQGRSVFVIDDDSNGEGWPALVQTATRTPQPHVLLLVGVDEQPTVHGVSMDRLSPETLVHAVQPPVTDARALSRVRRAAEDSRGLPGRFVHLLWPSAVAIRTSRRFALASVPRVAEQPVAYGEEDSVGVGQAPAEHPTGTATWPAPGELAALRRRMAAAVRQLAAGRHERGIRQLRQAVGGLARRDDWIEASDGALTLSSALLRRGRVRDAQAALEQARQFASRSGHDATLIDIAVMSGEAWIDLARLDEAETVLTAALASAHAASDDRRAASASLGLARCLFWRGQYADAIAALSRSAGFDDAPAGARLRRRLLMARAAVGLRDFSNAMALVADAAQSAQDGDQPSLQSGAACGAAFVHLAVGDLDAVDLDVATAISASRAAHDPLCALRARLLLAEAERRRGRTSAAVHHLRRLAAISTVPATIRVRGQLVTDLTGAPGDAAAIVARHVGATGLGALALYAPDGANRRAPASIDDSLVQDLVAILRVCQTADDERAVLKDVCGRLRQQLHASASACVAIAGGRHDLVAADGARLDPDIAQRAMTAGIAIAPCRINDRIEAAAPVQYGGVAIGAVCARWTLGCSHDLTRAAAVLTMAAAAVGPVLSAVLAHRDREVPSGFLELLGLTPALHDLRQHAQRAASAPFAVLVEGESGSGKELVARAIHRAGPRRDRPFVTLNCAALPDDLVEAELFGHVRGSFTGAIGDRAGVFEEAHGGTLFLDEVAELSPRAQAKLLRVIQEGELRRVGENVSRRVDVRIVSATNRDLRQEAASARFRFDLLYRLDVIRIAVPPLRERREDIALLAEHFWREATARTGSRATLGAATIAALARYDWPGNVRELQNVLAALAVRSPKRGVVPPTALPPQFADSSAPEAWRLDDARRTFDERFVRAALARSGGHRARAAEELGMTRQGLTKLMARLGIAERNE